VGAALVARAVEGVVPAGLCKEEAMRKWRRSI